jgi:hypothetical protein
MRNSIVIYLLLFVSFSNSQNIENEITKSYESYDEYFKLPRESLYIHTNKSSYLRGENLWFQGYAYNRQTQNLNPETRNVELGIYNNEGKMLSKKLYLVINGLFKGQISVDSTFTDGEYYLKANTHYMKNFNEDYTHLQKFEVIGSEKTLTKQSLKSYDLKVLPEGGYSVLNCDNTLALKLINQNGLGIEYDAQILENDKPIFDFKSNRFGHARANFRPKENSKYSVLAILPNGETIEKPIEDIKPFGYVISVNNILPQQTIINVSSYFAEMSDGLNNEVRLLIHQEGKRFEIPLELNAQNTTVAKSIKKDQLFYGVNTITLMVNGQPVAERLIFNRSKGLDSEEDISVTSSVKTGDSISLNLSMPEFDQKSTLSISVLPEQTISYVKNQNISSAFLLNPFLNGYIENTTYYFKNPNRLVDYNLDLLLLTQGWSRYTWNDIFTKPITYNYKRKNGLRQTVNINSNIPNKAKNFLIYSTLFNKEEIFELNGEKSFTLDNRYPLVGERMDFSLVKENNSFITPKVIVSTPINLATDNIKSEQLLPSISNLRKLKIDLDNNKLYANFLEGELLDEVIIKAKANEEEESKNYASSFKDNTVTIDEDFVNTYPTLADYLSTRGFIVTDNFGSFSIRGISRVSLNGSNAPAVFLNGVLLNDLSILSGSRTSDYQELYVDKSGYGGGVQAATGIIRLTLRKTPLFTNGSVKKIDLPYTQVEMKKGFEVPKTYYMPEYAFFQTESFQQVGTIAWFSDVKIEAGEIKELQIYDTGLEAFTLYIEGIAEDGSLINIEKTVEK